MIITEKFAKQFKKLRKTQGYSQEKFAKKVNLDRTYIASIEVGKRNISLKSLEKLAKGLNLTISELLKFEEPFNSTILLKIKDENFLLESKKELTIMEIMEIENICHCANNNESEFNEMRIRNNYEEELYEMNPYDIAELFQKIVQEILNIEVNFKPINLETKIWL